MSEKYPYDFDTATLIIEDLMQDFERAVRAAEQWWAEYKHRQRLFATKKDAFNAIPKSD